MVWGEAFPLLIKDDATLWWMLLAVADARADVVCYSPLNLFTALVIPPLSQGLWTAAEDVL